MRAAWLAGISFLILLLAQPNISLSQSVVKGRVFDADDKESIIGAWIVLADSSSGTITDYEGRFEIEVNRSLPVRIKISFIGYQSTNFTFYGGSREINIYLAPDWGGNSKEMVVSASRLEERLLEAPVSIQKMGVLDIQHAPTADFFSHLNSLKEVQVNTSGLTLQSVNTRGFADIQNWRFTQVIDGVDMALPGLGYAPGNLNGGTELDLRNIEIVPGPASALYGPNAFNGFLRFQSKSPFDYGGSSFYIKSGATQQTAGGSHPFLDVGFRYAKVFKDKWGFKLNLSYLDAYDWTADDRSYRITADNYHLREELLATEPGSPIFDGVNVYGDDVEVEIDLLGNGETETINRTGLAERDLVDYQSQLLRLNTALHYKASKDLEWIYSGRLAYGDALMRHTTIYPLVNVLAQSHKLEARGKKFFARSYFTREDAMDSYAMLVTGTFIQEGLKPSAIWARDYALAYQGQILGIAGGNHQSARAFADRDMAEPGSEEFQELRRLTLENPDILSLGSKFIDKSSLWHTEGQYDFSEALNGWQLQAGGNTRWYLLNSEGSLFNDGPLGFNRPIPIWEFGAYAQASVQLVEDHLQLKGALRLDKNQNFRARLSPRATAVISLGSERNHNFRFSAQSGFRNPAAQETYVLLNIPNAIVLGTVEDNINRYRYPDGTPGEQIFNDLVSLPSMEAFVASGENDPSLLQTLELDYLQQEQIFALEAGYKALLRDQFFVDVNIYRNVYRNMVSRLSAYSLLVDRYFSVYTNIDQAITSWGASAGISWRTKFGFRFSGSYSLGMYNADAARAQNPGFVPGFNMPQHRAVAQVQHRDFYKGVGFSLAYRWSEAYVWESPFGIGEIPSYQVIDASIHYAIPESPFGIKIGASNLLNQEYQTVYGGPQIGRQYFLSIVFE